MEVNLGAHFPASSGEEGGSRSEEWGEIPQAIELDSKGVAAFGPDPDSICS